MNRAYLKSAASDCASATCNWFGDSFFEASCRLGGKATGRFLGILKFLKCIDSTPPQGEYVDATIDVRRVAVEQRCGGVPLGKHGGVPRPALHPDVVDREMESGQDAAEALKPAGRVSLSWRSPPSEWAPDTR